MYSRLLYQALKKTRESVLLLGPRQCGKTTLLSGLDPDLTINLARESEYLQFAANPGELEQRVAALEPRKGSSAKVFIDEIQRLPGLLNTVQAIVDDARAARQGRIQFYLSGSSARKLRRGGANLLPGRVETYFLGPLVEDEAGDEGLDLTRALETGTLPGIYSMAEERRRKKILRSYAAIYLKEEVQAEALTKSIEGFARFLMVAASCSGQFLDLAKLGSQAQVQRHAAVRYFEILQDTLLVHRLDAFAPGDERRRLVRHPKFYFFDTGVLNATLGNFSASADRIGSLFEHFVTSQILHTASAYDADVRLSTYRTEHGAEVDLILEAGREVWAVEVKASRNIGRDDLRGVESFRRYYAKPFRTVVVYLGSEKKRIGDAEILPWRAVLRELRRIFV